MRRQSLLAQIAASEAEVILLHGKAGYGKTELARQYCGCFPGNSAWYTLDDSDNSPDQFGAYLDQIFACCLDGYGEEKENGAGAREEKQERPGLHRVIERAGSLLEERRESFLLVLDSFETIKNKEILAEIQELARGFSEKFRLCIITRGRIPDFLPRFVMEGNCLILEEPELAFTREEEGQLAGMLAAGEEGQWETALNQIHQRLKGWPAGVMLALLSIRKTGIPNERVDWACLLKASMIKSFLQAELFEELPEEEQEFLIQTAQLEELEAEICDRILKTDRSQALIENMLEKGILCCRITEHGVKISCHEILRLYLESCGDKSCSREAARRAAEYYLEKRDFDRAAVQAIRAGDSSFILQLMEQFGGELLETGKEQVLGRCICYLEEQGLMASGKAPKQPIAARPDALGAAAQYYYKAGSYEKMENCLNQADSTFGRENRFSMYRGLYRGLLHYGEDPEKNRRLIHNTLFLLEENHYPLPWLEQKEKKLLCSLRARRAGEGPGRLKVTFFGDFKAEAENGGKALSWRTRKGGELFAYMVKLNGKPAGRKQLLSALWYDELPDNAVTMLHNMLYNLRKELSLYQLEDLIEYRDKVYRIHMEYIDTDLWEIDRLCRLADRNDSEALLENQEKFQTCWGRYLENVDSPWAMEDREYYDTRFLKACTILAGEAFKEGRAGDGVLFYKNAMSVNGYSEELEAGLLKCYGAMDNLKQVKTEYQRFSGFLKKELQTEPGEELKKVYQELLKGQGV